ncbi:MAG: ATP-dependent DNA helicase RecG, partial [Spirochaetales bacterium]|nr:ATP-dependent DNA helicase RecG [Spirochaetales bacterium]
MIIYNDNLERFRNNVTLNKMPEILLENLRLKGLSGGSPSEVNSWNNSLQFMKNALDDSYFSKDCQVAIEYNIPQTSKRVDFMILGNNGGKDNIVIVELKQWAKVEKVDENCPHLVLSDLRAHEPVPHPSYQAYSYKCLILDYCDDTSVNRQTILPCTYLHNLGE